MKEKALDAAFRATIYRVETPGGVFELRIGLQNSVFDDYLRERGVSCWGIVTAFNPQGIRSDDENTMRHQRLMDHLQACRQQYFPACNLADDKSWPAEPSFLLLQLNEVEVCNLASDFFQRACVCGDVGSAPRLVWI